MADTTPAARAFGTETEARLAAAADRLLRYDFKPWFYGDSIGFEGLLAAAWLLDDDRYREFAYGFLLAWSARDEPRGPDDNTAPGLVLCRLAEQSERAALTAAADRLAAYLLARRHVVGAAVTFEDSRRSLREPYGEVGLDDAGRRILADPGPGIYVDCLHFDPPFFAAMGALHGDDVWAGRAASAAMGYVRLLQDPAGGLFHHFWLERPSRAYGLGWGRGQGWALLGLLDVLDHLPSSAAGRSELHESAARLVEAMLRTQRPDGAWHAVAGVESSGDETSTAAFMVTAFLRAGRLRLADQDRLEAAAAQAWAATSGAVDDSGLLTGVSAAVYSSTVEAHYHHVPRGYDVPWGQGPLLVAAAEMAASLSGFSEVPSAPPASGGHPAHPQREERT